MTAPVSVAGKESGAVARHIARAAARLFAARGYDATPVRAIVEAAGVTKPTLYYHFGSKEGLAQALVTVPLSGLVAALRGVLDAPGDPVDQLVRTFEAHFAFSREDPDRCRFLFALLFGPLGSGLATEVNRFGDEITALLHEAVARLAASGEVDPARVDDLALACRGMVVIATMDFLYRGGDFGPGQARRLVGDLLRGFGRPGDAAAGRGTS